jgi:hypothetical protein
MAISYNRYKKSSLGAFRAVRWTAAMRTPLFVPLAILCAASAVYVTSTQGRKPKPPTPTRGQVSLTWDLDNDSTVAGYNLYYTTNPTALTQAMHPSIPGTVDKISGISTTTTTLKGLSPGEVFYFGLTAYNANGVESLLSNVVSTPVP